MLAFEQFVDVKVNKFQNENMKSSHCPKYEQKKLKNSALGIQGGFFQILSFIFWAMGRLRVSVQGVKSLGGHFECVCRGFDFNEVK